MSNCPPTIAHSSRKSATAAQGPITASIRWEKWNAIAAEFIPDQLATPCLIGPEQADGTNLPDQLNCEWEDCFRGTIALCSQGCTYAAAMIVAGPHRGQIIYFSEEGPACFFIDHTNFISWYERWLDELLAGCDTDWFGFGKACDEETLAALLDDPNSDEADLVEATKSLSRIPALKDATLTIARRLLSHSSEAVRGRVVSLLAKGSPEQVSNGLSDRRSDKPMKKKRQAKQSAKWTWCAFAASGVALSLVFWYTYLTFAPVHFVDAYLFDETGRLPPGAVASAWRSNESNAAETPTDPKAYRTGVIDRYFYSLSFSQSRDVVGESAVFRPAGDKFSPKWSRIVGVTIVAVLLWSAIQKLVYDRITRQNTRSTTKPRR